MIGPKSAHILLYVLASWGSNTPEKISIILTSYHVNLLMFLHVLCERSLSGSRKNWDKISTFSFSETMSYKKIQDQTRFGAAAGSRESQFHEFRNQESQFQESQFHEFRNQESQFHEFRSRESPFLVFRNPEYPSQEFLSQGFHGERRSNTDPAQSTGFKISCQVNG